MNADLCAKIKATLTVDVLSDVIAGNNAKVLPHGQYKGLLSVRVEALRKKLLDGGVHAAEVLDVNSFGRRLSSCLESGPNYIGLIIGEGNAAWMLFSVRGKKLTAQLLHDVLDLRPASLPKKKKQETAANRQQDDESANPPQTRKRRKNRTQNSAWETSEGKAIENANKRDPRYDSRNASPEPFTQQPQVPAAALVDPNHQDPPADQYVYVQPWTCMPPQAMNPYAAWSGQPPVLGSQHSNAPVPLSMAPACTDQFGAPWPVPAGGAHPGLPMWQWAHASGAMQVAGSPWQWPDPAAADPRSQASAGGSDSGGDGRGRTAVRGLRPHTIKQEHDAEPEVDDAPDAMLQEAEFVRAARPLAALDTRRHDARLVARELLQHGEHESLGAPVRREAAIARDNGSYEAPGDSYGQVSNKQGDSRVKRGGSSSAGGQVPGPIGEAAEGSAEDANATQSFDKDGSQRTCSSLLSSLVSAQRRIECLKSALEQRSDELERCQLEAANMRQEQARLSEVNAAQRNEIEKLRETNRKLAEQLQQAAW